MSSLTEKEERIYEFIKKFIDSESRSPTMFEICAEFGYKNPSSVQDFISNLCRKGYLRVPVGSNKKRSIEVVGKRNISDVEQIPLEGYVAAGKLTEAVANRDYLDVPRSLLKLGAEYFALKIKGDSMIEECIADGDYVLIRRQTTATNGQIVVAMVEDQATIKKFYKKKTHVELHPANPSFDVIKVEETSDLKILGILSSVIRRIE
jgi:repressor LexA